MNKNIYFFIGTTAELIKLAPVIKELLKRKVNFKIISSNQNVLFSNELKPLLGKLKIHYKGMLKPYGLPLKNEYFRFFVWTIKILVNFILYFRNEFKILNKKNTFVIVHGDTVSSLIGTIAAKFNRVKLIHIESGLRSYNFLEPFPEELCRYFVSKFADIHFCPNSWAVNNLKKGKGKKINTLNNTLIETLNVISKTKLIIKDFIPNRKFFILVLHRQEHMLLKKNLTKKYLEILTQYSNKNLACVLVLHKLTENFINKEFLIEKMRNHGNIFLVPRLPYAHFIKLMKKAEFIATDGGSNQEEAYYLGKPCLILRNVTERIEGLGKNAILSCGDENIIRDFLKNYKKYKKAPINIGAPPSRIIVDNLLKYK